MTTQLPPRWDLSNVYPSLSSMEFETDSKKLNTMINEMEAMLKEKASGTSGNEPVSELATLAGELIDRFNQLLLTAGTLRAYIE